MADSPQAPENPPATTTVPPQEPQLAEFMLEDGTPVRLTPEQVKRAAAIGVQTVARQQQQQRDAAKKEPETKKEEVKKDEPKEYVDTAARAELEKIKNKETFATIERIVDKADIDENWTDTAKEKIVTGLALTRQYVQQRGGNVDDIDINKIAQPIVAALKQQIEKTKGGKTVVNVDEKNKDKKETELTTGSGKTAGQTAPAPLGRKSFKDGSLVRQIHQRFTAFEKKATE